jgi:hypothetical protein
MDPMEKIALDAPGFAYEGRKCSPGELLAPTGAGPFLAAHLKSLEDYPPRQGEDTLSVEKAIDKANEEAREPERHPRKRCRKPHRTESRLSFRRPSLVILTVFAGPAGC